MTTINVTLSRKNMPLSIKTVNNFLRFLLNQFWMKEANTINSYIAVVIAYAVTQTLKNNLRQWSIARKEVELMHIDWIVTFKRGENERERERGGQIFEHIYLFLFIAHALRDFFSIKEMYRSNGAEKNSFIRGLLQSL